MPELIANGNKSYDILILDIEESSFCSKSCIMLMAAVPQSVWDH